MQALGEPVESRSGAALQVGEWRVTPELNQISRGEEFVHLEPKAMAVLVLLAGRAGEVLSREELLAGGWPGVVVGDNALTQVVIKLRKALGDTAHEPAYIQAISKGGYRLIAAVGRADGAGPDRPRHSPDVPSAPRRRTGRWAGAAVLLAMLAGGAAWFVQQAPKSDTALGAAAQRAQPSPSAVLPTVIVKPFETVGDDAQLLLIAGGVTADLVTDLSKVSGIWVVSGVDPQEPSAPAGARDLAAAPARPQYLLTGTVLRDGPRMRLHVHLVDVDGGKPLWSQRFDRDARDLFAVQDDLVRSILEVLPVKVSEAEARRLAQRYTRNLAAYEHFLRGTAAQQVRGREQNEMARAMYWKAIDLDPAFARAYAGLAMTYALAYQQGWDTNERSTLARALEFARTAVQMSPNLPEAHWVLGFVQAQRRQHDEALGHLEHALRLNPSFADAYAMTGAIHTLTGRPAKSIPLMRTAQRLGPGQGSLYFMVLGRAYYFLGDNEQARLNLDHALLRNAENLEARIYLAAVLSASGKHHDAAWQVNEIRALEPGFDVNRWLATYPMTDAGQRQRLVKAMEHLGLGGRR